MPGDVPGPETRDPAGHPDGAAPTGAAKPGAAVTCTGHGHQATDPAGNRSVAQAMARMLECPDPQSLLATAFDAWLAGVGGSSGAVHLLQDDGSMRMAMGVGYEEELLDDFRLIAAEENLPVVKVARSRRPMHVLAEDYRERYPDIEELRAQVSFSVLPLLVDERCLGTLSIQLERIEPLSAREEHEIQLISTVCAHRLDHLLSMGAGAESDDRLDQALRLIQGRSRAARLELAMTNAEIGSFDWDFASGRLIWDERLCRIFGIAPETFDEHHETFLSFIHPGDRDRVSDILEESKRSGEYRAVYRIVWPDGSVHWIDAGGRVFQDSQGRPMGMIGVAQDRTGQKEREQASAARQEFVVDVTRAVSEAMTTHSVLETLHHKVLPRLGGISTAVFTRDPEGMQLIGHHGFHGKEVERLRHLPQFGPGHPILRSLSDARPLFFANRDEYRARFPQKRLAPHENVHAAAWLPLSAGDDLVGIWMINYAEPREFTADEQVAHTATAGIIGQSLARAQQFDARRRQMNQLQKMMLPRRIPEVPGLAAVVRYLPGSKGLHVGGDWYDLLSMPDGRVALAIGDVQGHSAEAAAVMGQLRTAMWAHAKMGPGLSDLMGLGNRTLIDLETELFATCCMVEIDPSDGRFTAVRAGHPFPLIVLPDGEVRELEVPGGLPLGTFDDTDYPVLTGELPPGAILLLFTDGLVERPGADYADAVGELMRSLAQWTRQPGRDAAASAPDGSGSRVLAALPGDTGPAQAVAEDLSLAALADLIVTPALSRSSHDDIAVLLVRRTS